MANLIFLQELKSKKVLVTGGCGFVGHNLVKELIQNFNCEVTVVDNLLNSSYTSLESVNGKFRFIQKSIVELDFHNFLEEFDYIFHLACIQIAHSSKDPVLDLNTNAVSTLKMLEFLLHNPNNLKRFVYTSSASVYGNAQNGICLENGATKVLSHYAATKLLGENYTSVYYKQYQIPATVVRYSNVFGYGQTPYNPYCGVIGKFIDSVLKDKGLQIFGDGQQTRDYTFITDTIKATLLAAVHPNAVGEIFNVGTGVETSVNKLAELINGISGKNVEITHVPPRDIDNIRRRVTDISHIHDKIAWEPEVTIENGLEKTIEWYLSHK
jgi:UDP-glucose 4-epimerase